MAPAPSTTCFVHRQRKASGTRWRWRPVHCTKQRPRPLRNSGGAGLRRMRQARRLPDSCSQDAQHDARGAMGQDRDMASEHRKTERADHEKQAEGIASVLMPGKSARACARICAALARRHDMLTADNLEEHSAQRYHWCREEAPSVKAHHSADASPQNKTISPYVAGL